MCRSTRVLGHLLVVPLCLLAAVCGRRAPAVEPAIEFTAVPPAAEGGSDTLAPIAGRVAGARPGQRIVLYAKSGVGVWWVQPLTVQPFTPIEADSTWKSRTHLGMEYAALLVRSGFRPQPTIEALPKPGGDVIIVATVKGTGELVASTAEGPLVQRIRMGSAADAERSRGHERLRSRQRVDGRRWRAASEAETT